MKKIVMTLILGFAFVLAKAQIPQPDPDTTARHFMIVSSIKNLQEVSAGELASQKSKKAEVRSFAQMMLKDHGEAEKQLLALAKKQNIALPAAATGEIKPDLLLLNAGSNFDNVYVHAMVSGHQNAVQTFENYATTGKDPALKAFAQEMLPTLRRHLAEIKAIEEQLKEK